jgi:serine/threonine-protein kinase
MSQKGDHYDYPVGTTIPGYPHLVVLAVLGQGGMGTVYLVEDTTIAKKYALKTIHRDLADQIDMAARMRKEARALVLLRHENIVDVITMGQTADDLKLVFIQMEYLEGWTLKTVLRDKGGHLDLIHVLDIASDVARALETAHAEGFVHRDIKPDNIFLVVAQGGANAKAVVLDFGIVGIRDQEADEDRGRFMGTPRYAAPEQSRGGRCVAQSDLYSLAVVMFEAIAGHGPFPGVKGAVNLANAHLNEPAPRLSTFVPDVNPDLDELLFAALQKEPSHRHFVDKATKRRVVLTAISMGIELRRIRREEGNRRGQQVDENKTQETLLGVIHPRVGPESTVDDPNIAERLAAHAPGRANTLVGLAPAEQGRPREGEQSASGPSPPPRTPVVTGSHHLFPPTPDVSPAPRSPQPEELLSHLGGGLRQRPAATGAAAGVHQPDPPAPPAPPPVASALSLRGVPASTDPIPPPRIAARLAETRPESAPAPPASDSRSRIQAPPALAEQAAAGGPSPYRDEMDAAKARVPLVGPAAGRLRAPPTLDPTAVRSRDSTDPSASRTLAPALPFPAAYPQPRRARAPLVITLLALGACVVVIVCAAVVVASRSWRSSSLPATPTASATAPAGTIGALAVPVSAAPAASSAPAPAPSTETVEASIRSTPSVAPAARPRVAPQTAKPAPRTPSLITTAPLGSGSPPDVGDPFKKPMGW